MGKNYHTIAFDLDGTLTDPSRGLTSAFKYAFKKWGIDCTDEAVLRSFIGPPIRELWQELYSITPEQSEEVLFYFREYFSVYGWWDNDIFAGVQELLADLKRAGKKIILATSKPDVYSSKILKRFNIDEYFDFSEGASFDTSREKKWDVLEYAMKNVGVLTPKDRAGVLMVGDTKFDIEGAKMCAVDSLGVLWGFGSKDELASAGADYIAESIDDIRRLVL